MRHTLAVLPKQDPIDGWILPLLKALGQKWRNLDKICNSALVRKVDRANAGLFTPRALVWGFEPTGGKTYLHWWVRASKTLVTRLALQLWLNNNNNHGNYTTNIQLSTVRVHQSKPLTSRYVWHGFNSWCPSWSSGVSCLSWLRFESWTLCPKSDSSEHHQCFFFRMSH